jgi:hypothetical protein
MKINHTVFQVRMKKAMYVENAKATHVSTVEKAARMN